MNLSPLSTASVSMSLLALAAWCGVRALRPRARTVSEVRAILHPDPLRAPSTERSRSGAIGSLVRPATAAVARTVDRRLATGLSLAGTSASDVAARITAAAATTAVISSLAVLVTSLQGMTPGGPLAFAVVPMLTSLAAWSVWTGARRQVQRAKDEFRRTTNDVIQLVAVGLTTDQSVESALQFALGVGESAMFALLRDELAAAPLRGVSLWEAIDEIGHRSDQRELCELATAVERQGTRGVSISETVSTLARSMREGTLARLERDADRANANLAGPTVAFVCTTIVFLAYPLAVRVSEAFGGT